MKRNLFFSIFIFILFCGCDREITSVPDNKNESAIIVFGKPAEENNVVLNSNNNIVIVGTGANGYERLVSCFSFAGKLLWEHTLQNTAISKQNAAIVLPDGSIIINSFLTSNYITKISARGDIVYHKQYNTTDTYGGFSAILLGDDGFMYFSFRRYGAGNQPQRILKLDPESGNPLATYTFTNYFFDGNPGPSQFYPTSFKNGKFFAIGNVWLTSVNYMACTLYPETNNIDTVVYYDTLDYRKIACYTTNEDLVYYVTTYSSLIDFVRPFADNTFKVKGISTNFSIDLDVEVELDVRQINARSIKVIDNEIVIVGDCIRSLEKKWSGFVLKLDLGGNILQEKYFLLDDDTHFTDCMKVQNNFILVGHTVSFGKGKEQSNRFYLKTDKDFMY